MDKKLIVSNYVNKNVLEWFNLKLKTDILIKSWKNNSNNIFIILYK